MKLLSRAVVALSVLAVSSAFVGCGEDKKAPETPQAEGKAEPKAGEGDKAKGEDGDKAAKPAEEAKQDDERAAGGATTEKAVEAKKAAAGDEAKADEGGTKEAKATAPAAGGAVTVAWGGMPGVEAIWKTLSAVGGKVAPGMMPADGVDRAMAALQAAMQVTDISWLQRDKPVRFFVADPKRFAGGQGVVLPVSDKDKVLASLKDANKDVDGHAATYQRGFETVYVDFVDGHAVMTNHKDTFEAAKSFITDRLLKWTPKSPIEARVDMDLVNKLYESDIKSAREMLKELYAQMNRMNPAQIPGMNDLTDMQLDLLFGLVESAKEIALKVDADGDAISVGLGFQGRDGTGMQKFVKVLEGKSSSLAAAVPDSMWLGMTSYMDVREVESMKKLSMSSLDAYAKMLQLSDDEQKKMREMFDKSWGMSPGDAAFAVYTDGKFPFALSYAFKATKALEVRELYHGVWDLLMGKALGMAKQAGGFGGAKVDSLADLAKVINQAAPQTGVELAVTEQVKDGLAVDSITVQIDWNKMPIKDSDPELHKILSETIGKKISLALAYKGEVVAFGLGPNGTEMASKLARGEMPGGEPTLTKANEGHAMALVIQVGKMLKTFSDLSPGLARAKDQIEKLPKDIAVIMQLDSDGSEATFSITLPMKTMAALTQLGL